MLSRQPPDSPRLQKASPTFCWNAQSIWNSCAIRKIKRTVKNSLNASATTGIEVSFPVLKRLSEPTKQGLLTPLVSRTHIRVKTPFPPKKNGFNFAVPSVAEIRMVEEMCSPEIQWQVREQWRDRINGWAGGIDTYQDIFGEVRTNPQTLDENVEPHRWWKS